MYHLYLRVFGEEVFVDLFHERHDLAFRRGLPSGVGAVGRHLHAGHGEAGFERVDAVLTHGVAAGADENAEHGLPVCDLNDGQVARRFDDAREVGNEAQHAVVASQDRIDEVILNFLGHERSGHRFFLDFDLEVGLDHPILVDEVTLPFCFHRFFEGGHVFCREREHGFCFARNGIAHVAAFPLGQTRLKIGNGIGYHTCQILIGVGATFVDLESGVPAAESVEHDAHRFVVGFGSHGLEFEFGREVDATCRSDHEFAVRFIVEVEQNVAFEQPVFHVVYTIHGGFLIGRDESFEGTVAKAVVLENGHNRCHGHPVVGAERRVARTHPFAVDPRFDGIGFEVVLRIGRFLRHHVHVSLQRHHLAVFHTGRCGLVHQDVAGVVKARFNVVFLRPVEQELLYFLEMSRGAGHLVEKMEIAPDSFRLELQNFAHNVAVLDCFFMKSRSVHPHAPASTTRAV